MENSYALKFSRESFFPPSIGKSSKRLNYRFAGLKCLIIVEPRICIIIFRDRCRCNRHCARYTRRHDCYYETRENVSGSNRYSISGNKTADRVRCAAATTDIGWEFIGVYTCTPVSAGWMRRNVCISIAWLRTCAGPELYPPPPSPEASFTGQKIMGWLYHLADVRIFLPLHLQSPLVLAQHVRVYASI